MLYCHVIVAVNALSVVQRRIDRSSHRKFSIKKGVLTNFSKFTGKHLCQSLLFKRLYYRIFSVNFPKFVGPLFITKHLWRTASAFRTMSNIYDRTFLWKQQVVTVFEKKNNLSPAQVFPCKICESLKNTFFHSTPPVAAF